MADRPSAPRDRLDEQIRLQVRRRLKPQPAPESVWTGLGFMGMVGWTLALPILLGALLGRWLDRHLPQPFSWTLVLILFGLVLGAVNVWRWISRTGVLKDEQQGEGGHD